MSIKHILQAFEAKVGNSARKLVLIKLADNANDQGFCWPSHQYIADQCEISKRSVINHISALEEMGLVTVKKRKKESGGNHSNYYYLHFDGVKILHGGSENSAPSPSENSAPITCHSLEPVKEPICGKAEPKKEKRMTQLPDSFEPNENNIETAKKAGIDIEYQLQQFKDWHLAKGSKYKDWNRAFNTWLRKSVEFSQNKGVSQQQERRINDL